MSYSLANTIILLSAISGHSHHKPARHAADNIAAATKSVNTTVARISKGEDQLCSVNTSDLEIDKVLPLLSAQTGLNLLLVGASTSKITMHVEGMKFTDVLHNVCALCGLDYLKTSGAFVIATPDTLKSAYPDAWNAIHPSKPVEPPKQEPPKPLPVTATIATTYIRADLLVDSLKKLYPNGLDIVVGPAANTPDLNAVDASTTTGQNAVQVTKDTGNAGSRTLILRGEKSIVEEAEAVIKSLDTPRPQVDIEVTVHDISNNHVKDLGLSWTPGGLNLTETPGGHGFALGTVTQSPLTFDATIAALETKDIARLVAAPNVAVLDGEKAFILIGDRINYPVLVGYSSTNAPIFSVNTERVGIYLQVAANIGADGSVTLTLYPQVSQITGYLNVNGASYPQVSSREAQTTLRVKSGDTIVLGGLMQDQDIFHEDKTPILSQLPFLGQLFQHRTKTHDKSQIIITLRPKIITSQDK
jgi:type II secretory pathway component HofQ